MIRKLSIIIPVYNEEATIQALVEKVISAPLDLEKELIIIDDCSTDNTPALLNQLQKKYEQIRMYTNDKNQGKGFSLRKGIEEAAGDIILIQDADLEYDPSEYPRLLQPILDGKADVVYGSRFVSSGPKRVLYYWHFIGNTLLTTLSNIFSNLNLSDMETCYKVFAAEIIKQVRLTENRFGFEPEVTYKLSRIKALKIYEVGISYAGRTYEEGKKINWKDGIRALYVIIKNPVIYFFKGKKYYLKS